jgi:hypothetical protein
MSDEKGEEVKAQDTEMTAKIIRYISVMANTSPITLAF